MPKTISHEEIRLDIVINGDEAQKELQKLEMETYDLSKANKALRLEKKKLAAAGEKESKEYKQLTAEISKNSIKMLENKNRMTELQKQIGLTGLSMRQLKGMLKDLYYKLDNAIPEGEKAQRYELQIKQISNRLTVLKSRAKSTKFSLKSLSQGFNQYAVMGASAIAAITGVVFKIQELIDYNGKLADAQSDVIKTTDLTKKEVKELSKSFGLMKTRTARIELLKLAEEAGRLGIKGTKNIKDFVEVANQLKVALGDDISDVQIREVGKMAKIYKVGEKTGRDFKNTLLSLGSAINEVSASGANTAGFLVDYLKRQAGVAAQTKISAQDNIGYAATFDELGQSVEVSATAMNKVWIDMFKDSESYAEVAGIGVTEFTNLLQTDANAAMIAFLKGLNGNNEGLAVMAKKFEGLEVGGARGIAALSALAGNTKLLEERQTLANKALDEATSLTKEYEEKNNNLAGSIDKIRKRFRAFFSSESINKGLNLFIGLFGKLIGAIDDVDTAFKKESESSYNSAKANRHLAEESSKLLEEYENLSKEVNLTTEQKEQLDIITLQLKDRLGESVIEINKETGAYILNTKAVKEQIDVKRLAADEEAATLVSRVKGTQDEQKLLDIKKREAVKEFNLRKKFFEEQNETDLEEIRTTTVLSELEKLQQEERLKGYKELEAARSSLQIVNQKIETQQEREIDLLEKLKELNFSQEDVDNYFKASTPTKPKDGTEFILGGLVYVWKNGVPELKIPKITPTTKREIEELLEQIATITKEIDLSMDFSFVTPKQKEELDKQKDFLIQRIGEIIVAKNSLTGDLEEVELGDAGQMDVLGFSAEQWLQTFTNLDTLQGKFKAAEMVVGGLLSMWNMYQQSVEINEAQAMAKFEARTAQKKDRLKNQLDNGVITQRTYTKEIEKIEKQHDKTQRELEYQKAKRAHQQMVIQAIGQAAMAVLSGLTATPFLPVGIAMGALAAILGGIQVAMVAKNKPVKGFQDGLYPMEREQDGKIFNVEYGGATQSGVVTKPTYFMTTENNRPEMVIDNNAFRKMNPDIRNSMIREVARVKGFESGYYPDAVRRPEYTQNDTSTNEAVVFALNRYSNIMERIEQDGIIAIVSSKDYNNMREIKDGLDNYNELRNKNKI